MENSETKNASVTQSESSEQLINSAMNQLSRLQSLLDGLIIILESSKDCHVCSTSLALASECACICLATNEMLDDHSLKNPKGSA